MSTATETAHEPIGVHGQPPAHRPSNRPAGYVDAHCIKCHTGLFVPPGTESPPPAPPAPEQQSAEDQRGLACVQRRLGKVSMVEFAQTRRYVHFASGTGTTTYHELWDCIINVAYGGPFFMGNGDTATAAAEAACAKVIAERERLAAEAEHEQADQEIGERFDGLS